MDARPQPTDETRNRYDSRSWQPMAHFLLANIEAERESREAYLTFEELIEYGERTRGTLDRAHYYGGTTLEMEFTFEGQTYFVHSNDDETWISGGC